MTRQTNCFVCAVVLFAFGVAARSSAQVVSFDAFSQNQRIGRCVNILGYDPIWRSRDEARFQSKHFRLLKDAGFDSVRINLHPFRHMKGDPGLTIPESWFETLDWAVSEATSSGLMVILDFHEFGAMSDNPEGEHDKFIAVWQQLAEHYKNASNQIVFEILNEPSKKLTPELWNKYLQEALSVIRKTNPNRSVIVGPSFWNSIDHLQELELPARDRNLIVTVHYYTPMEFTHQGADWSTHKDKSNVDWLGTAEERKAMRDNFSKAATWSRENDRPIFLGEFGAYEKAPMKSRVIYTDGVARTAESFGWSWGYWQFDSDFILYDIDHDTWVSSIRDALIPLVDQDLRLGRYSGKPFKNKAQTIPGRLECEFYDEGGEGLAYHETDGRNHGSGELNRGDSELHKFRKDEDVDTSYTKADWDDSDFNLVPQELGGLYLGWTATGEWLRYSVDVEQAGIYTVSAMYTSRYDGSIQITCDGKAIGGPIPLKSTANANDEKRNWHHWNYHEKASAFELPSGRHVLTIRILAPGNLNLDYLLFKPAN